MALVNSITYSTTRRDLLISLRNGFTYVSNLIVLGTALVLFAMVDSPVWQFRILSCIVGVVGFMTTMFFLIVLSENAL